MTGHDLWNIIENVRGAATDDIPARIRGLHTALRALPTEDVISFSVHFQNAMGKADNDRIRGAAYLLLGGCSDDTFWDSRAGLLSCGRTFYAGAISQHSDAVRPALAVAEGLSATLRAARAPELGLRAVAAGRFFHLR